MVGAVCERAGTDLYDGKIDIIVNSMKDMPAQINDELPIIAIPERGRSP